MGSVDGLRHFSALLLLCLVAASPCVAAATPRLAPRGARGLTLDERVAYQRAVEEVYWRHKVWPAENARPKPPLDEVVPDAVVRARAEDALRFTTALEAEYRRAITPAQLKAEIDRMVSRTRQPELLRDLFAALDDDPAVIAECLARPILAERLLRNWYARDARRHAETRARAEAALAAIASPEGLETAGGDYAEVELALRADGVAEAREDRALRLSRDEWDAALGGLARSFARPGGSAAKRGLGVDDLPIGRIGSLRETETAFSAVAVLAKSADRVRVATASWKKTPFDVWWSGARPAFEPAAPAPASYGAVPAPAAACADDTWHPTASQMPARAWHTAVWTGTEMIVWGGTPFANPEDYFPAGRYNPATDTWTITSNIDVPEHREKHTAVWTGTEMIVWGGYYAETTGAGRGGRYNPQTDTWTALPTSGAPSARNRHTAVWTGSKMIVWGGQEEISNDVVFGNGASFDPATNAWTALPSSGAPSARSFHTAVWTGSEMIVWGGVGAGVSGPVFNTGARYNPATNQWIPLSASNAPSARFAQSAVWSGSEMIVWGGRAAFDVDAKLNTGARYNPATNAWTALPTSGAPTGRDGHVAVFTGSQMLVWGGSDANTILRTGGRYTPATNSWSSIATLNAPEGAAIASAVWTGSEMIVWGGHEPQLSSVVNTGGRYDPQTDSWAPVTPTRDGGVRNEHPAIWTGTEMIVWGSYEESTIPTNTGARYMPATDTWVPTSMVGVPVDRYAPIAVWTGTEMVVWGGCDDPFCFTRLNSGGRYNPQSDTWRPTSMAGAPVGRYWFSAAWTGSQVLVWGGCDSQTCGPGGSADPDGTNTGGRYDPVADTWQSLPVTATTPAPRWGAAAAWTGSQLLVWGGLDGHSGALGTGGRYDLASNQWLPISNAQAPVARWSHRMVWTGSEAIVWGGTGNDDDTYDVVTGGRYTPATDSWQPTSTANAPQGRAGHTAVWTGREMIVWGGCRDLNCQTPLRTGGRYNPVTNSWAATSTAEAPSARDGHSAVWTGTEMIVFGGEWGARNPTVFDTGGRYCLAAPSYDLAVSPTAFQAAPGESAPATVTVSSVNGFSGGVSLAAVGLPTGATAAFANAVVTPQANGTASTGLTVAVGPDVPPGQYVFQVTSSSGGLERAQAIELTVAAPGGAGSVGLHDPAQGAFFLRNAPSSGPADFTFSYGPGGVGWRAITGDWNGDGVETIGLYDPANGVFFLKNSSSNGSADVVFGFGPTGAGLVPLAGDWDGDGDDTVGLYNPATGAFFLRDAHASGSADHVYFFGPGGAGWQPLAGDWNGDGVDTVALYAPTTGAFFLRNAHENGAADAIFTFGPSGAGWQPIASDWNGDGVDSIGLYDPSTGVFFLENANAPGPADLAFGYGPTGLGLVPVAGDWDGN